MSLLGHILGTERPSIPEGGRAFVTEYGDMLDQWAVCVAMPGEDQTPACKLISPVFMRMSSADAFLGWVNGGPPFRYPADGAA